MKRTDLERLLVENGFVFVRNGSRHDVYKRGAVYEVVPRHREVNELLARKILKRNGIELEGTK